MRGNKFEHMEKLKEKRDKDKAGKSAIPQKLRVLFAGFTDDELAILFPSMKEELNGVHKPEAPQ
jgi:hypothetical protein